MTSRKPEASSTRPSLAPVSSRPPSSWPEVAAHVASGVVSLTLAFGILAWLPVCLDFIRLPAGGVTHDPWAWAPFALDLGAAVAVAAPTSFGRIVDVIRAARRK
jgi:hypothetical protein